MALRLAIFSFLLGVVSCLSGGSLSTTTTRTDDVKPSSLESCATTVDTAPMVAHIEEAAPAPDSSQERPLSVLRSNHRRRRRLPTLNGWIPDEGKFLWGLPGSCPPLGDFDPLALAKDLSTARRYREAEIMHGRIAMVATVGYIVGEEFAPVVWDGKVSGPANEHLELVPGPLLAFLTLLVGIAETLRARRGFVDPDDDDAEHIAELKVAYYPGDLGFDPFDVKPRAADDFADVQTKELNHGRLAMIAIAGMVAQELVTHQTLKDTLNDLINGLPFPL